MCQDHNYNYKVYCKNFNGLGKNKFRTLDKVVSFADIMIRWVYNNSIFIVIIFFFSTLVNFNSFCNYQNLIRTIFGLIIYLFDFIVRLYHDILIWHHKSIKYYLKKILICVKSLCFHLKSRPNFEFLRKLVAFLKFILLFLTNIY